MCRVHGSHAISFVTYFVYVMKFLATFFCCPFDLLFSILFSFQILYHIFFSVQCFFFLQPPSAVIRTEIIFKLKRVVAEKSLPDMRREKNRVQQKKNMNLSLLRHNFIHEKKEWEKRCDPKRDYIFCIFCWAGKNIRVKIFMFSFMIFNFDFVVNQCSHLRRMSSWKGNNDGNSVITKYKVSSGSN